MQIVKSGFILLIITAVAAVLLGYVHDITLEPIAQQEKIAEEKALGKIMPDSEFKPYDIEPTGSVAKVQEVYSKSSGEFSGYVVTVAPTGYGGKITMVVGIDANKSVKGIDILSHNETPGLGANCTNDDFKDRFKDRSELPLVASQTASAPNEVQAITSATITTAAVSAGVNEAYEFIENNIGGF